VHAAAVTFAGGAGTTAFATSVHEITSNRLGVRYRFPFGLGLGFVWDRSTWEANTDVAAGPGSSTDIKRTSWAIPVTYEVGNHGVWGTYGRARDWKGTFGGCSVSDTTTAGCANALINAAGVITVAANTHSLANDTGARFVSVGYTYKLSQRTNVHVSYNKVSNDALARYDFFANTSGTAAANAGADPRMFAVGLRHTF
jgi:predicted porin